VLQFDRTLRQSELWRLFKRNAQKGILQPEQVDSAISFAKEAANVLRQDEANDFVDSTVPEILEELAIPLQTGPERGHNDLEMIDTAKQELAADLVESVNNASALTRTDPAALNLMDPPTAHA
jgi:hypothetical protein